MVRQFRRKYLPIFITLSGKYFHVSANVFQSSIISMFRTFKSIGLNDLIVFNHEPTLYAAQRSFYFFITVPRTRLPLDR